MTANQQPKVALLPLTKSPHERGRVGPRERQDWYVGLVEAARRAHDDPKAQILVISAFQAKDSRSEVDLYVEVLHELGISDEQIVVIPQAMETVEQLHIADAYAREHGMELVVISSKLHSPRVRKICKYDGIVATHYRTAGIPRPWGAVTDIGLTVLFPALVRLGLRDWFARRLAKRRASGKI